MFDFSLPSLLAKVVILLVGFPIHELAHAAVASLLGDNTAQRQGRLSLNPLAHLDPVGSMLLLVGGIGWAKPVPISPWRLRYGPHIGGALVAAAGPISNLLMAGLVAVPWRLGWLAGMPSTVVQFAYTFAVVNVALFLFNLIPLAPLDGFRVLQGAVGRRAGQAMAFLGAYGPLLLLGLFLLGTVSPRLDILGGAMSRGMAVVMGVLLGS